MANVNYTGDLNPGYGWKPQGALAGMLYRQDRQRYDDVSSLQDYMTGLSAQSETDKFQDYLKDSPVRDAKRLADIATSGATAATIGGIKQNELEKGTLENAQSRVMNPLLAEHRRLGNDEQKYKLFQQEITKGINTLTQLEPLLTSNNPVAVAMAQQVIAKAGIPELNQLMQGSNQQEISQLVTAMRKHLIDTNAQIIMEREKGVTELEKARIMAAARTPQEKEFSRILEMLQSNDPRQVAVAREYLQSKRYGSDPFAGANAVQGGKDVASLEKTLTMLRSSMGPDAPLVKQLEQEIQKLKAAGASKAPQGTAENPIPLD